MSEPVTPTDNRVRLARIVSLSAAIAALGLASTGAQAACSPWNSSTAYTAGNTVTEGGVTYKANWWTQGNEPARNNGGAGSGQRGPTRSRGGPPPPPPPPAPNPPPPAPVPPPSTCNSSTWQRGINYPLGAVVLFPGNGNYYKEVNVGANGSDGTDPTISTWYWQPTTCSGGGGGGGGGGGNFVVSDAQFNQMFPSRNGLYTYAGLINAMGAYPAFAHTGSDTTQKQEAAAFLANVAEESDSLRATREYNTANWPLYCDTTNGNTCAPGQQYYGRGPMQLSWNYNYRAAGNALGIDLWSNPDLVATDATIAWKTAVWYWMTGTGSAGVTPHNAMVNGQGFGTTIRAINGSVECDGRAPAQVATRINFYNNFTGLIGVTPGGNLGC
jgi:chitodextrinase